MFLPCVSDAKSIYERKDSYPDFITTHPQAEILINGNIGTKDIIEIHFADFDDFNLFKSSYTNKQIFYKYC